MNDNFILLLVFYLVLLLGVVLYFLWLIDKRNRQKLQTLRGDWANRLHSDIGGNLSSIKLLLELINYSPEQKIKTISEDIEVAMDTLNDSINKLRFVIDIVDDRKDSLDVVLDNLLHHFKTHFSAGGTTFSIERPPSLQLTGKIDIIRVNKLYLLLKEVMNNCLKHSQAKNVTFRLTQKESYLFIEIEDDGIGFDLNQKFNGNGLKDLREHSKAGSLLIQLHSELGKGTHVGIKVFH